MKKMVSYLVLTAIFLSANSFAARAEGAKEGVSSFILPTTGQYMNGEFSDGKTKLMAGMEVAAITTTAILASVVGGPIVWAGIGPLIANHTWSGYDAYKTAKDKSNGVTAAQDQQVYDARRDLDLSRQQRYDAANNQNLSLRERMRLAAEQANNG